MRLHWTAAAIRGKRVDPGSGHHLYRLAGQVKVECQYRGANILARCTTHLSSLKETIETLFHFAYLPPHLSHD